MSALTAPRDTREIYCNATTLHRVRNVAPNAIIYPGAIVAVKADGNAVPASDAAGLTVIGRVESYAAQGRVIAKSGVFIYANATATEALGASEINKICYVIDDQTVGKIGGTNKIPAGIVRDITPDGVVVELGSLAIN